MIYLPRVRWGVRLTEAFLGSIEGKTTPFLVKSGLENGSKRSEKAIQRNAHLYQIRHAILRVLLLLLLLLLDVEDVLYGPASCCYRK